jgi:methylthioribose-1-phosphate isomerase
VHNVEPIEWTEKGVLMLDQRKLPTEIVFHTYTDYREVARAIHEMEIRGAPAIGIAAAMGIALGVQKSAAASLDALTSEFQTICETFARTRPTAVDLFWAIERFQRKFETLSAAARRDGAAGISTVGVATIGAAMVAEAHKVHRERRAADRRISELGAVLMPQQGRVMTQCNAGALATARHRHGARSDSRGRRSWQRSDRSAGARNASVPAGRAPHRVGIAPGSAFHSR